MDDKRTRIAITHGDTNGIGYETIFKVFSTPEMFEMCTPIIYGSPKVAAYHSKALNLKDTFTIISKAEEAKPGCLNVLTCFDDDVKVDLGTPTEESGIAAMKALDRAMTDARQGLFDALVSAPADCSSFKINNMPFDSLAHFINTCVGNDNKGINIYANSRIRVAMLTDNCSFSEVTKHINKETIVEKTEKIFKVLKRDFRLSQPRIAVLALNPDGEGKEEKECIMPAVEELAEKGMTVFGPYQADSFFASNDINAFDCVLAMYHDQGIIPFHMLQPEEGICSICDLPLVCTYPDMTPQFDIAGKGTANETQLRYAVYAAIDICRNRHNYDIPLVNPLPKLYKEKREDGDRQRFATPRQKEKTEKTEKTE